MLRDEIRVQRDKLKGKSLKEKLDWFWEYDKVPFLVTVGAVALVIAFIYTQVTYVDEIFGVMFINAVVGDEQEDALSDEFLEVIGVSPKEGTLYLDLSETLSIGDDTDSSMDYYSLQIIMARTAANQIDIMVADAYNFQDYAESRYFLDLREVLSEETLEEYSEYIYYVDQAYLDYLEEYEESDEYMASVTENTDESGALNSILLDNYVLPDPDEMEDPIPIGIMVNDAPYIVENENYPAYAAILGVLANTDSYEYCELFLEYLFEK